MELNALLISFQDSIAYLITVQNVVLLLIAFLTLSLYSLKIKREYSTINAENNRLLYEVENLSKENIENKKQSEKTIGKLSEGNNVFRARFSKIIDVDNEVLKVLSEKQKIERTIEKMQMSYKDQEVSLAKQLSVEKSKNAEAVDKLNLDYKTKKAIFDKLVKLVAIYDEEIELADLGFYKPRYDFDTSEKYKEKLTEIKEKQKELVRGKQAIFCNTEWTMDGNRAKGRSNTNNLIRLTARAFNNECNDAISNTRWNNAERMELRVEKAFGTINKLNQKQDIHISEEYLQFKVDELNLAYEYKEKRRKRGAARIKAPIERGG